MEIENNVTDYDNENKEINASIPVLSLNQPSESNIIEDIENKLEKIFTVFVNSTNNILTNSDLLPHESEKNIDLKNSDLHRNRLEFEKINPENIENIQNNIRSDAELMNSLFRQLDENLSCLKENKDYLKSEKELLEDLRKIKEKQQDEMCSLDELLKTAKETVDVLEFNSKKNTLFN